MSDRLSILKDLLEEELEKDRLIQRYKTSIEELQHVNEALRHQLDQRDKEKSPLCFNCTHAKKHLEGKCHCNTCCYECNCG